MTKRNHVNTCAWCRRPMPDIVDLIDHVLAAHHTAPTASLPLDAAA